MLLVGIIGPRVGLGGIGSSAKSCSPSIASFRMPWQLRNPHIQTKLRLRCFAQASSRRWPTRRDQQSDQQSDQQRRAKAASCISKSHGTVFSTPYLVTIGMACNAILTGAYLLLLHGADKNMFFFFGTEIPERLIIYHAGTGRITFLAMLKLTSLLLGAFFTFLVVPSYVKAEKPMAEIAAGSSAREELGE